MIGLAHLSRRDLPRRHAEIADAYAAYDRERAEGLRENLHREALETLARPLAPGENPAGRVELAREVLGL